MAVKINGNDIVKAFTGGNSVKAIYSGGVKVWPVDTEPLPEGYTKVTCIYSSAKSNVNNYPCVKIPMSTRVFTVEMDIKKISANTDIVYFDSCYYASFSNSKLKQGVFYGSSLIDSSYTISNNTRGIFKWEIKNTSKCNMYWGTHKFQGLQTGEENNNNLYFISNAEYVGDQGSTNKIYSVKIYIDNVLSYHLIPVLKDSTGKAGLYDVINNVFYGKYATNSDDIEYDT